LHEELRQLLMKKLRRDFSRQHLTNAELLRHRCADFCTIFEAVFGDRLQRAAGWLGNVEHHWMVDKRTGEIVDPTREQFSSVDLRYKVFNPETDKIYVGKCMNCGDEIHDLKENGPRSICSDECETDYKSYLEAM
jgi:hypothetical protein